MADNTHIEWTDATWNPITGCSVTSPGCTNCYAMKLAGTRLAHHPSRAGLTQDTKAGPVWTGEVRLNEDWLTQPLKWKRPRRIFVCAHGDLFHENVPDEWIDRVFAVMALCPQHTFQVLTKRSARMRDYMDRACGRIGDQAMALRRTPLCIAKGLGPNGLGPLGHIEPGRQWWPLPNTWLGVSVEDQARADERIPDLLATPAAVRFLSCEPLLGPVDLTRWLQVPSKIDEHFLCLGSLDDEERHNSGQDSLGVADTGYFPDRNGLPPMPLNSVGAPADVTTPIGAQPVHDFGGCAVDRESGAICPSRPTPPVEIPLPVEQSSEVGQCGNIGGNRHCLVAEDGTSAPSDPLPGNFPLDARPARPQSRPDGGDGFAGAVSFGNGGFPSGIVSCHKVQPTTLHWVIVGGESGPGARPMHPDWARSLRDQCQGAGVPFFFKQVGEWFHESELGWWPFGDEAIERCQSVGEYYRVGKKAAGRLLDGREWNEVPA